MSVGPCMHFDCQNKNSFGYCKTTACINEKYCNENVGSTSTGTYSTLYYKEKKLNYPISHVCCICFKYEYPDSDMATTETWICSECAVRIRKLIYPN